MNIVSIDSSIYDLLLTKDPMFHRGWITFNERKWNLKHELLFFQPDKGNSWQFYILVYYDKKNRIVVPPRNPYLPSAFICNSNKICEISSRTRAAYEKLVEYLSKEHINGPILFSPEIADMRAFIWDRFTVTPRYSYIIELNEYKENFASNLRTKINKARKAGYYCEECDNFLEIVKCLAAPESRKGFGHLLKEDDYVLLNQLMTRDNFICFVVKNAQEEIKGAWVQIYNKEGIVLAWSAGIYSDALSDGVNFLLGEFVLDFFHKEGCKKFDLVGANIPTVARMKEAWGGKLVTYYRVSRRDIKSIGREIFLYCQSLFK